MTLWGWKFLLLAICRFSPQLMLKYYITEQVNRVSDTKFMWLTTYVTCQLLVPSPTYFEIIYDLVGSTKLVACHLWVLSPTCFEILYDLTRKKNPSPCSPSKRKKLQHSWVTKEDNSPLPPLVSFSQLWSTMSNPSSHECLVHSPTMKLCQCMRSTISKWHRTLLTTYHFTCTKWFSLRVMPSRFVTSLQVLTLVQFPRPWLYCSKSFKRQISMTNLWFDLKHTAAGENGYLAYNPDQLEDLK
jgi:hypothetical protein